MEKCAYCGKPGKEKEKFCSDECKRRYEKELQKDQRNIRYFLSGIGLGILCLFAGAITGREWAEGGGLILTGLTIFIFPFTLIYMPPLFTLLQSINQLYLLMYFIC